MNIFNALTADAIMPPYSEVDEPSSWEESVIIGEDEDLESKDEGSETSQGSEESSQAHESSRADTEGEQTTAARTTEAQTTAAQTTAAQTVASTVQPATPPPVSNGVGNVLTNLLFVVIPLTLAALAALIGIFIVRKRKSAANNAKTPGSATPPENGTERRE